MHIVFIVGSHRKDSQSSRVASYLNGRLIALHPGTTSHIVELGKQPLPLWEEGDGASLAKVAPAISDELKKADAVVAISPEWSGMVPAALKNFFLMTGHELAHKPGLIVAVSAARNGAYPVAELRMSSYKNLFLNWIPDNLIVRDVANMLQGETPASNDDAYLRKRADYSLNVLIEYAKALKNIRDSGVIDLKSFANGM